MSEAERYSPVRGYESAGEREFAKWAANEGWIIVGRGANKHILFRHTQTGVEMTPPLGLHRDDLIRQNKRKFQRAAREGRDGP